MARYLIIFFISIQLQIQAVAFENDDYLKGVILAKSVVDAPEKIQLPKAWLDALFAANELTVKSNREYAGCLDFGVSASGKKQREEAANSRLDELMRDLDTNSIKAPKEIPKANAIQGKSKPTTDFQFEPFIEGKATNTFGCANRTVSADFHTHPTDSEPFSPSDLENLAFPWYQPGTLSLVIAKDRKIYLLMPTWASASKRGGLSRVDTGSFYVDRYRANWDFGRYSDALQRNWIYDHYIGLHCIANAFGIAYYAGDASGILRKADLSDCSIPVVDSRIKNILLNFKAFEYYLNETEVDGDVSKYLESFRKVLGGITGRSLSLFNTLDSGFKPDEGDVVAFTSLSKKTVMKSSFDNKNGYGIPFNPFGFQDSSKVTRPLFRSYSDTTALVLSCESTVRDVGIDYIVDFIEDGKCLYASFSRATLRSKASGHGVHRKGVLYLDGKIQWDTGVGYEGKYLVYSKSNAYFSIPYGKGVMTQHESTSSNKLIYTGRFFNDGGHMMFEGQEKDESSGIVRPFNGLLYRDYYKKNELPSSVH